jgi:hypothetical protein
MIEVPDVFIHYLAAWNEMDRKKIRGHLQRSCAHDVLFIDPLHTTRNIDELEAMIVAAREERPTSTNNLTSGVDGHNLRYRYLWLVSNEGKPLIEGMDVTTLNEQGMISQIDGFFGSFPEKQA